MRLFSDGAGRDLSDLVVDLVIRDLFGQSDRLVVLGEEGQLLADLGGTGRQLGLVANDLGTDLVLPLALASRHPQLRLRLERRGLGRGARVPTVVDGEGLGIVGQGAVAFGCVLASHFWVVKGGQRLYGIGGSSLHHLPVNSLRFLLFPGGLCTT